MTRDPFRRPPMVDIPADKRESWWRHTTRKLTEAQAWKAETFAELCELSAQFCEGKFTRTPDHAGPRAGETVRIGDELAHANRHGFLTTGSQPGEDEDGHQQRAAVEGWASPETVKRLEGLVAGTRLQMQASDPTWRRADYSNVFEATRQVCEDGSTHVSTEFGFVPSKRTPFIRLGHEELVDGAKYVSIHDPEWGDHSLLWDRLAQPDWDNPAPSQPDGPQLADHDRAVQRYTAAEQAAREQGWPSTDVEEIAWYRQRAERKRERFVRDNPTPPCPSAVASSPEPPAPPVPETPMSAPTASRYVPVDDTDDGETRRVKQAHNNALFLGRTAVTDDERRAAARAREEADALRGAYVGRLSDGVDAAFAERDRLADVANASGRDEDEAAMLHQDAHAAELLDQYNAEVQTDRAESDRRRAENLRRYREHRDNGTPLPTPVPSMYEPLEAPSEDGMDEDASGGRLDTPPAAQPYSLPRATATPPHLEIKRTGRWYDDNPITSTNTTPTGGSGMSIGDARQGMLGPIEKLNEALGLAQSAHAALEEAQAGLLQATEGSNQAEADQAHAQVAESLNKMDDAQQQVAQALPEFEGVAQRL